jgi:hypothetical protein
MVLKSECGNIEQKPESRDEKTNLRQEGAQTDKKEISYRPISN